MNAIIANVICQQKQKTYDGSFTAIFGVSTAAASKETNKPLSFILAAKNIWNSQTRKMRCLSYDFKNVPITNPAMFWGLSLKIEQENPVGMIH